MRSKHGRWWRKEPEEPEVVVEFTSSFRGEEPTTDEESVEYEAALAELRAATESRTAVFETYVDTKLQPDPSVRAVARGTTSCPSCGTVFEVPLKSSRKCPACAARVIVRSHDGNKFVVTAEESEIIAARKKIMASLRKAYSRVEWFGVTAEALVETLEGLGPGFGPRDASWRLLNLQLVEFAQAGSLSDTSFVCASMARQLCDEGKDYSEILTRSFELQAKWESQRTLPSDADGLRILACSCDACVADDDRVVPWGDLEETANGLSGPLPHLDCEHAICPCSYQAHYASSIWVRDREEPHSQ